MIQLIDSLPFDFGDIKFLKGDWDRFKEGRVTLDQIPNGICGEFECEAEMQVNDSVESGDEEDESESGYERGMLNYLPSGRGRLIITISKLYWIGSKEDPTGWSIDYQHVLLHAISKPSESRPYIYLQLSCNKVYDISGNEISLKSENEDEDKFVEVNLYVEGEKEVDDIFVALSECTSLHPCEDEYSDSDENSESDPADINNSEPQRKIYKLDEERFEDAAEK